MGIKWEQELMYVKRNADGVIIAIQEGRPEELLDESEEEDDQ